MKFKAQHYLRSTQLSQITRASTSKQPRKKEALEITKNPKILNTSMKSTMTPKVTANGLFLTNMPWKFEIKEQ